MTQIKTGKGLPDAQRIDRAAGDLKGKREMQRRGASAEQGESTATEGR